MTKMTDAFKKIFLGLGGDPKELAENNDVGDYILDLEGAIKKTASDAVGEVINDNKSTSTTTYSSRKINSLISDSKKPIIISYTGGGPDNPVLTPSQEWWTFLYNYDLVSNTIVVLQSELDMTGDSSVPIKFGGADVWQLAFMSMSQGFYNQLLVYKGIVSSRAVKPGETKDRFYELYCLVDFGLRKHRFVCKPIDLLD